MSTPADPTTNTGSTHTDSRGVSDSKAASGVTQAIAFEILSNKRRRHVLHYLLQHDQSVSIRDLSAQLAAWENDTDIDNISYQQRRRVYTALRQVHLPKLSDAGLIDYDSRQGTATLVDEATELEVYLDVVPHNEIPWSTYYIGLGILSHAFLAGVAVNLFPLRLLPDLWWGVLIGLLFTGSALAHRYHERQMRLGTDGNPPI